MTKTLQVALNDLRISFKDGAIWLNLVIIPVILIVIIGAVNGGFGSSSQPRLLVDVFDADGSALSAQFLDHLRTINDSIVLCPLDDGDDSLCRLDGEMLTPERAQSRLKDNQIEAVLEIPAGFGQQVLAGQPVNIVYRSNDPPGEPSSLLQTVQAAVQRIGSATAAAQVGANVYAADFDFADAADRAAFEQDVYARAAAIWSGLGSAVRYTQTAAQEDDDSGPNGFSQSVPGMGSMYVMFTVLGVTVFLIQERKNGTLQRLFTMPVSRVQLLSGKILARFTMGMIQYVVAFTAGFFLGVSFGKDPFALGLVMVSFTLCITALSFLFGNFVTTEQQAGSFSTLIVLTAAPLGGAWWPLEIVPDFMRIVGHISPIAWAMDAFNELMIYDGGLGDVLIPVGVLLAATAVMFGLAITQFKVD